MSDYHQYATTLAIQKLAAWAFAVGERPRIGEEHTRPRTHRGQLPDVDFDRAIVDPNHRPLWLRIVDFLSGLRRLARSAKVERRESPTAVLGERLDAAYIGEEQTGEAPIRATDGNSSQNSWSCAA
jgi:hypothetical protein